MVEGETEGELEKRGRVWRRSEGVEKYVERVDVEREVEGDAKFYVRS